MLLDEELGGGKGDTSHLWRRIRELGDEALMANRHDFVTAPNRMREREQKSFLFKLQRESGAILEEILARTTDRVATSSAFRFPPPPSPILRPDSGQRDRCGNPDLSLPEYPLGVKR